MASKQQRAKERQGYEIDPVLPVCSTCQRCTSRMVSETTSWGQTFEQEKDLRCGIGGFAIKKTASCVSWEPKA